jgi:hypothetical protein
LILVFTEQQRHAAARDHAVFTSSAPPQNSQAWCESLVTRIELWAPHDLQIAFFLTIDGGAVIDSIEFCAVIGGE